MSEFKQYRRKAIAELRPVDTDKDAVFLHGEGISISAPDLLLHDTNPAEFYRGFIARNPANHNDQWYVARAYFDDNFEPIS